MVVFAWYLDLQLTVQSVPITNKVVSLNPAQGEVYSMQHSVIQFVSSVVFIEYSVSSIDKIDRHDIVGMLLKVELV